MSFSKDFIWCVGGAANATFGRNVCDVYMGLNYAMDLTPLIKEQSIDIAEYVAGYIQRFYDSVNQKLKDLI